MAQFATQGSLKLLLNGEGVTSILEHRDPLHYNNFRSIRSCRRRLVCIGSSGRVHYSSFSSSMSGKWSRCNAEPRPSDCVYEEDDSDDDDFENDNLSCFRGLVLDVSYRSFFIVLSFLLVYFYFLGGQVLKFIIIF